MFGYPVPLENASWQIPLVAGAGRFADWELQTVQVQYGVVEGVTVQTSVGGENLPDSSVSRSSLVSKLEANKPYKRDRGHQDF